MLQPGLAPLRNAANLEKQRGYRHPTQFKLPQNFYLDIPSARIGMIGCIVKRVHANNIIEARFLRLMSERDLNRIFVYSTHPNHRNRVLDIYR